MPSSVPAMNADQLKHLIREVPDFPKPGILFYDITTLLKDKTGFATLIDKFSEYYISQAHSRFWNEWELVRIDVPVFDLIQLFCPTHSKFANVWGTRGSHLHYCDEKENLAMKAFCALFPG